MGTLVERTTRRKVVHLPATHSGEQNQRRFGEGEMLGAGTGGPLAQLGAAQRDVVP